MGTAVQIIAGLYYAIASAAILNKLFAGDEYDLIIPTSVGRPSIDSNNGFGLLGFSAGLHSHQRTGDSGITSTDEDAWRVKIPWEVHLRRNVLTQEMRDKLGEGYWEEQAEIRYHEWIKRYERYYDALSWPLPSKSRFSFGPPPEIVNFELRGKWLDDGDKVTDFTFEFQGEPDFTEVTLGHMQNINSQQNAGDIKLRRGGQIINHTLEAEQEKPVFFHKVFNPDFGVTDDWDFSFKDVRLYPVKGTTMKKLRTWFDYENPHLVSLSLSNNPVPAEQELDYDWW